MRGEVIVVHPKTGCSYDVTTYIQVCTLIIYNIIYNIIIMALKTIIARSGCGGVITFQTVAETTHVDLHVLVEHK